MKKKNGLKFFLLNLDVVIASAAMCTLVALTFAGVIARYVVGKPFTWIEEIQAAMIVWVIFGAAGAAFRTANHAAIEVFYEMFPDVIKKILNILILIISIITLVFMGYYSIQYMQVFLKSGRTTPVLHISYVLIFAIVPVSCIWQIVNFVIVNFFHYSEAVTLEEVTEEDLKKAAEEFKKESGEVEKK